MTTLTLTKARKQLGDLVTGVSYEGDRVAITRNGRPQAVLISVEDAKLLSQLEDKMDMRAAEQALAEGDFMPLEDFIKELRID